jgi:hypothetical protein
MSRTLPFITLLLAALALVPGMAHLLEMYRKMQLTQESYGAVQYIYGGWALLGVIQFAAVLSSFLLFFRWARLPLVLISAALQVCTLAIFFIWTYPVNRITQNWSVLPVNWESLRVQWEYSHAVNAILELIAYILLLAAVLGKARRQFL